MFSSITIFEVWRISLLMKKLLTVILFITLQFSFCLAQDTLVLRNGQRICVNVISVTDKVNYSIPPDDKQISIGISNITYIKYKSGFIYTLNRNIDTNKINNSRIKLSKPYFVISGGASVPFGGGYNGNTYAVQDPTTGIYSYNYVGYANTGSVFSAITGVNIYAGWGLEGNFSFIRNQFDASGFMSEMASLSIDNNKGGTWALLFSPINNVTVYGSYYYNNYSCLFGITKDWDSKFGGIGFSLLMGALINEVPALHGIAMYQNGLSYYLNVSSETQRNFAIELGIHGDINITNRFFLLGLMELQFSEINYDESYQIVDMTNGNTINSGSFMNIPKFGLNVFNATLGVGYKF